MQGREKSILGDSLALLSALFYAVYVILLKVRIRSESRIDMQLFFGFVGLFNIIGCWPIGLLLHLTGVEKVELPSSGRVVAGLLVNVSFSIAVPCEAVASHKRFYCRWLSRFPAIISM
jgi:solute carrier family 35, member F5